jgi:DNA-binding transcriptional ArsR family regulator
MPTSQAVEIDWTEFLRTKVNSFIKWDLVRFFHDNPHTKDTPENIARYTGRELPTIERELNGLVEARLLKVEDVNKVKVYRLTGDKAVRRVIREFMDACHDREFRVRAIHQVIKAMQQAPGQDY